MSDLLHKAVRIAFEAHAGQSDKQGEPYIFHVMRVALSVRPGDERIVALLHDVVEDTAFGFEHAAWRMVPLRICEAVDALSRRKAEGETYAEYIERVALNPLATAVKIGDLKDNLSRIDGLPEEEGARLRLRYHKALNRLFSMMPADVVETERSKR